MNIRYEICNIYVIYIYIYKIYEYMILHFISSKGDSSPYPLLH